MMQVGSFFSNLLSSESMCRHLHIRKHCVRSFFREEDGVGTVEVILILVVLIGIVIIFKNQITNLVNSIWRTITSKSNAVTG